MDTEEKRQDKRVFRADLTPFYPEYVRIDSQHIVDGKIEIAMKSLTQKAACPYCGEASEEYHSTYKRKIEDLPLLGSNVFIRVTAYRYYCGNPDCGQKVFAEELEGFAGWYRRKTSRLEDLIASIALNTNCEGCSRICKAMGVNISGDYVIGLLKKRFEGQQVECGEVIGVDDFAYKKGRTYGTIICDGASRKPVAILDGRDGASLKEWLLQNKHVKIVTRDRADSYAKAIREALPDAIQVADRFHLFQNLIDVVKDTLKAGIPENVLIADGAEGLAEIADGPGPIIGMDEENIADLPKKNSRTGNRH
jgi:transposase